MSRYIVTWAVDIEATSPLDAARQANDLLNECIVAEWSFTVLNKDTGDLTNVDMENHSEGE